MITTAEAPKILLSITGFGITMKKANLGGVGIKKTKWIHYSFKAKGKDEDRKKFLEKVKEFVSNQEEKQKILVYKANERRSFIL